MAFQQNLETGKTGETLIARYLMARGWTINPVYEQSENEFKGPAVFLPDGSSLVAPDMQATRIETTRWIEAKHKSAFTWHRNSSQFLTGINLHHYKDYVRLMSVTSLPIWLMFLQRDGVAKDTPEGMISPTGLYGGALRYLIDAVHHDHPKGGPYGMVYWAIDKLKKIANLEEVINQRKEQYEHIESPLHSTQTSPATAP